MYLEVTHDVKLSFDVERFGLEGKREASQLTSRPAEDEDRRRDSPSRHPPLP